MNFGAVFARIALVVFLLGLGLAWLGAPMEAVLAVWALAFLINP